MAETTGQLDKLIANKVDKEIKDFTENITNQIKSFLEKHGNATSSFYQASKWDCNYSGSYEVKECDYLSARFFQTKLTTGLSKSLKDRMITRETESLLKKIDLLS